jgi:predicted ATP-grasp superfamily ATP-dependent carboligase
MIGERNERKERKMNEKTTNLCKAVAALNVAHDSMRTVHALANAVESLHTLRLLEMATGLRARMEEYLAAVNADGGNEY